MVAFSLDIQSSGGFKTRERRRGFLLAVPALIWLAFFFIAPLLIVVVVSVLTRGSRGAILLPLTLEHYQRILSPVFLPVFGDSLWISFLTTVFCLLLGYPLAFFISTRRSKRMQSFALFLVILPFWTNFLVRTYAWRVLLGSEGTINVTLMNLGVIAQPLELLNTDFAVLIGLVYGFLPFMVLPIYSSVERFEFRLVEAAHDLGANDIRAFLRVVVPLTLPGVIAGCILVFIPAIGSFITPDLLGGTSGIMIGNLIQGQFKGSGNWPLGSAASVVMMGIVMMGLLLYVWMGRRAAR
ncbi:MAG: ABC transporter permease [Chloroflexota bacterium]|nr:ABC transporter permease [Chloroflexota bacterium]